MPKVETREFVVDTVKKLTGIELADESLLKIVAALIDIEDKKKAYSMVFEGQEPREKVSGLVDKAA